MVVSILKHPLSRRQLRGGTCIDYVIKCTNFARDPESPETMSKRQRLCLRSWCAFINMLFVGISCCIKGNMAVNELGGGLRQGVPLLTPEHLYRALYIYSWHTSDFLPGLPWFPSSAHSYFWASLVALVRSTCGLSCCWASGFNDLRGRPTGLLIVFTPWASIFVSIYYLFALAKRAARLIHDSNELLWLEWCCNKYDMLRTDGWSTRWLSSSSWLSSSMISHSCQSL